MVNEQNHTSCHGVVVIAKILFQHREFVSNVPKSADGVVQVDLGFLQSRIQCIDCDFFTFVSRGHKSRQHPVALACRWPLEKGL